MPLRQDYLTYPYTIESIHLSIQLDATRTQVNARLNYRRKPQFDTAIPMVLNGAHIELSRLQLEIAKNNHPQILELSQQTTAHDPCYSIEHTDQTLTLHNLPESGCLHIQTHCNPKSNTSLSGLFATGAHLMTQCEAEGFRRITYYPDRPDVLSIFTVELHAQKIDYPVLLSNGNLINTQSLQDGWHCATWHDPFPKPAYLFAIVAGQLAHIEETIQHNGQPKLLQVYVEPHDLDKAQFALDSLKASIEWDQQRYGLALDLDRFMIVATDDFNMGAMENKGLNIFNSKFVLAHPDTATDTDYEHIEAVVGHEYFHNWTGNRVTCQDWFQLSLKEGLTVYRDQEFSADQLAQGLDTYSAQSARAVQRIQNVINLRSAQFMEDSGPMAHPIRPNAYEEINNFYTMTVYEKGAEIVRMYETLLGREGFRRGMDEYFKRHDGQAVTCDDFRTAMADANQTDLTQFARWYEQAGTPRVHASGAYDANRQEYTLTLTQTNPPVGIELGITDLSKPPLHIPLNMALVPLNASDSQATPSQSHSWQQTQTLHFTQAEQTFVFKDIAYPVIPSLNRGFGAPINLEYDYTDLELIHLLQHDNDPFNRWDAVQNIYARIILSNLNKQPSHETCILEDSLINSLQTILSNTKLSPAYRAMMFTLPSYATLSQAVLKSDALEPQLLLKARESLLNTLAQTYTTQWRSLFEQLNQSQNKKPYQYSGEQAGVRSLKLSALSHWVRSTNAPHSTHQERTQANTAVHTLYQEANNMTDRYGALSIAVQHCPDIAVALLQDFYQRHQSQSLVIDKWFAVQASQQNLTQAQMQSQMHTLMNHPQFANPNPNRFRALIFTYCNQNPRHFHRPDGSSYQLWADQVIAQDGSNPQIASRLARSCEHWRIYKEPYQSLMKQAIERIAEQDTLSQDTREIIDKSLSAARLSQNK